MQLFQRIVIGYFPYDEVNLVVVVQNALEVELHQDLLDFVVDADELHVQAVLSLLLFCFHFVDTVLADH